MNRSPLAVSRSTQRSSARRHAAWAATALTCALLPATARGQAGLLVPTSTGRPDASVLALREMKVDVSIARGHARVNVRQVFENRTASVQEGTYRFRLPPSASVSDFAVWDGLVRVPGVILEKRRARAIYRELTMQRIDPGLLQQGEEEDNGGGPSSSRPSGGAAFSARVSPIPAWATKRLELQFQQEAGVVSGSGEFRLALRPLEGDPLVASHLAIRVRVEDVRPSPADGSALPLTPNGNDLVFDGNDVRLERDLVVRFEPQPGATRAPERVPQPQGHASRRPRARALGAAVRDPAGEGRLLPARDAAAARARDAGRPGAASGVDRDRLRHLSLAPLVGPGDGVRPVGPDPRRALAARQLRARRLRPPRRAADAVRSRDTRAPRRGPHRVAGTAARARQRRGRGRRRGGARGRQGRSCAAAHRRPAAGHLGRARARARRLAALHFADRRGAAGVVRHRLGATCSRPGASEAEAALFFRRLVGPPDPKPAGKRRPALHLEARRSEAARRLPRSRAAALAWKPLGLDRPLCRRRSRRCSGSSALPCCPAAARRSTQRCPRRRSRHATCRGAGRAPASTTCCA